jgi:tRNA nucleotidyltransferase (CCA-adding enzyme)
MGNLISGYPLGLGLGLSGLPIQNLPYSGPLKWIAVRQRFEEFHSNVSLTPRQRQDGMTKRNGVVDCLNRYYYGCPSDTDHSFLIGSWGKGTAVRPPRDVDLYFVLPFAVYSHFQRYGSNRPSALLQEVKAILIATYPDTDMSGDGQVVVVRFESYSVEVVPAFLLTNNQYCGSAIPRMEAPTKRPIHGLRLAI